MQDVVDKKITQAFHQTSTSIVSPTKYNFDEAVSHLVGRLHALVNSNSRCTAPLDTGYSESNLRHHIIPCEAQFFGKSCFPYENPIHLATKAIINLLIFRNSNKGSLMNGPLPGKSGKLVLSFFRRFWGVAHNSHRQ